MAGAPDHEPGSAAAVAAPGPSSLGIFGRGFCLNFISGGVAPEINFLNFNRYRGKATTTTRHPSQEDRAPLDQMRSATAAEAVETVRLLATPSRASAQSSHVCISIFNKNIIDCH